MAYLCVYVQALIYVSVYKNCFFWSKKKGFPFVSLRSENNFIQFIEAKQKIGSEKKRKNRTDD